MIEKMEEADISYVHKGKIELQIAQRVKQSETSFLIPGEARCYLRA